MVDTTAVPNNEGTNPGTLATTAGNCPNITESARAIVGRQMWIYFTAPDFNPQLAECWVNMRTEVASAAVFIDIDNYEPIITFIDMQFFSPGERGILPDVEIVLERVIAQAVVNPETREWDFRPDPFGRGKYNEVK